ncbi:hypothetical protein [Spongiactinospora sp. TRM90649]|uniref:hypothetical protein n=1 Tax=Spongiactinospora sp. TRM90649 TaxID=3031114 RepID=UPI0023F9F2BF|nr:hypothetical protein [Spongiactinospora sp. TRM90649]MDF5756966.1 hypothetical protein [Spongiactinospora sp. TRM90649]
MAKEAVASLPVYSLTAGERALFIEGDLRAGRLWFDTAYRDAERRNDAPTMARAALGLGGLWVHEHRSAAEAALLRERQRHALKLADPTGALALRLRARIGAEEDYGAGRHDTIFDVLAQARRKGDPIALVEALSLAHHCVLGPEHGEARMALAHELMGRVAATGRPGDLLMALMWRTVDLFLAGDPHAERSLAELRERLSHRAHLAVGFVVSAMEVMLCVRAGRLAEAETLAAVCARRGAAAGDVDSTGWYGGQLAAIRWYQGRIAELVPALSGLVHSPELSAVDNSYTAVLAVAAAEAGDRRLAVGMLARLRGRDLADLPRSSSWLTSMHAAVEAAHLLGDTETAARAYELLLPFGGLPVIASLGVACLGSAWHALGVASMTTGDLDRAVEHLRAAVRDNLALGHWPAAVLSRWRLGQALALRHGPRDARAVRETAQAAKEAAELGMALPVEPERPPSASCVRRGRQWQVELGARSVLVDHCVGMEHLAVLIANPGREVRAADLAAGPLPSGAPAGELSAQPVLDDEALRAYRSRLMRLEAEIADLEACGEPERAEATRGERDWLVGELSAAAGLGGRTRRFTGGDERARIAVGKAIRRALTRITTADPAIGGELRATIHTGLRCTYRPR